MQKITNLFKNACRVALLFVALASGNAYAQVYAHDFGVGTINSHPYTVAPTTIDAGLSNSSWSNSNGSWGSAAGSGGSGAALLLSNSSGTPTITLTFDVATGKQLAIDSFSFWSEGSSTGAQSWSLTINGIAAGSGTFSTTGTAIPTTTVANAVTGLTGTVNVVMTLGAASGSGAVAIDDFTLNGAVTTSCTIPPISSIYPESGPEHTVVTINGSGFLAGAGTSNVQFNGVDSNGFTVVSDNVIKAVVPAMATTGVITITTNGCIGTSAPFTIITSDCVSMPGRTLTAQPASQSVCESDDNVSFSIAVDLPAGFSYQWKVLDSDGNWVNVNNNDNYAGATTETLTISDTPLTFSGNQYYCLATSGTCNLVSNATQLTVSPLPVVIATPTGATCLFPTGSITITPSIGDGLTYSLNGTTFQASTTFSNLLPGDYFVTVKSSSGCISVFPVTVEQALDIPLVASVSVTQPTCNTPTGTIEISGPIGAGISYSINGTTFQQGTAFAGLIPGQSYNITVQNLLGCISVTTSIVINLVPPPPTQPVVTVTQPTCTTATGTIEVTTPVGTGITYSIDGTNYQSAPTFAGLTPNSYTVTVVDNGSCPTTIAAPVIINPLTPTPAVATLIVNQLNCEGIAIIPTGSIEVTAPLGTGITYSIDGVNYQAGTIFADLAPGSYTVSVIDNGSCPSVTATPAVITPLNPTPAIATVALTQPVCTLAATLPTGTIEVTSPIGSNFTYSVDGITYQTSPIFPGLSPGSYTIYVKDGNSCPSATTTPADLIAPPAVPATATVAATQPTCTTTTGSIEVTAPLGSAYTYSLDGITYQAATTFANLIPGSYTVYVKNLSSCPSATTAVSINTLPATPAVATVTATQPNCTTTTGSIEVTAPVGGTFTYSLDNITYQSSPTFTGLSVGNYTVYVRDGSSCPSNTTTPVAINAVPGAPVAATVSVTQPTCTTSTGSLQVTAPLGGAFTYSLDNITYQAGTTFSGLTTGNYTVYVKNGSSCPSSTATPLTINAVPVMPSVATVATAQPDCTTATGSIVVTAPLGGTFTYSLDNVTYQNGTTFSGLAAGNYTVYVKDNGSCPSATTTPVTIIAVPATPAVATVTATQQPTCSVITGTLVVSAPVGSDFTYSIDGTTYQTSATFANLAPGSYTVYVKNGNSCASSASTPVIINAIPNAPNAPIVSATQPTCNEPTGTVEAVPASGTGNSYSLDGISFQASPIFAGLAPGNYTVVVRNSDGCISAPSTSVALIANTSTPPQITGLQGCRESISGKAYVIEGQPLNNTFNINTATFAWTDANGNTVGNNENMFDVSDYLDENPTAQFPLQFTLTVTTPGGCSASLPFTIEGTLCGIPKGISPNNDGKNDSFSLIGMNVNKVSIFNRYGQQVFSKNNYTNEWIGQGDNGDKLPSGTYYYVIEAPGNSQTGWVYVNREEN